MWCLGHIFSNLQALYHMYYQLGLHSFFIFKYVTQETCLYTRICQFVNWWALSACSRGTIYWVYKHVIPWTSHFAEELFQSFSWPTCLPFQYRFQWNGVCKLSNTAPFLPNIRAALKPSSFLLLSRFNAVFGEMVHMHITIYNSVSPQL